MKRMQLLLVFLLSIALAPVGLASDFATAEDRRIATPCVEDEAQVEGEFPGDRLLVKNSQGEELGEIVNFVVDTSIGRVAYVLIDTGHALAMEDLRLVPVNALEVENDNFILNMDEGKLANSPAPEPGEEPEEFHRRISEYYGVAPYWED